MTYVLPLDSDRWKRLGHAYGSAGGIPPMLRGIKERGFLVEDDLELLWGGLYHQGTIYTATYAAAPHMLSLIDALPLKGQHELLTFLGRVAGSWDGDLIPDDLKPAYKETMSAAASKAIALLESPDLDSVQFTYLLLSITALIGRRELSELLEASLVNEEVWARCPLCADSLRFDTASAPFRVRAVNELGPRELEALSEDVLTDFTDGEEGIDPPVIVSPAQPPETAWAGNVGPENAFDWLYGAALRANQEQTAQKIRSLFGRCECPTCRRTITVMEAAPS